MNEIVQAVYISVSPADFAVAILVIVIAALVTWLLILTDRRLAAIEALIDSSPRQAPALSRARNDAEHASLWRGELERLQVAGKGNSPRAKALRARIGQIGRA